MIRENGLDKIHDMQKIRHWKNAGSFLISHIKDMNLMLDKYYNQSDNYVIISYIIRKWSEDYKKDSKPYLYFNADPGVLLCFPSY